jgi:hypothetical protein
MLKTTFQEVILPCPSLQMLSRKVPPAANEKPEIGQKFLISQPVSEIPPNPLKKEGQGGFMAGSWLEGKSYLLLTPLSIY